MDTLLREKNKSLIAHEIISTVILCLFDLGLTLALHPGEDCGRPHQTVGVSLASSQAEALQMQSLLSGSCKRSI